MMIMIIILIVILIMILITIMLIINYWLCGEGEEEERSGDGITSFGDNVW